MYFVCQIGRSFYLEVVLGCIYILCVCVCVGLDVFVCMVCNHICA